MRMRKKKATVWMPIVAAVVSLAGWGVLPQRAEANSVVAVLGGGAALMALFASIQAEKAQPPRKEVAASSNLQFVPVESYPVASAHPYYMGSPEVVTAPSPYYAPLVAQQSMAYPAGVGYQGGNPAFFYVAPQ